MNKQSVYKFAGGALSGAAAATTAFLVASGCDIKDEKEFYAGLAITVGSGLFHYAKNEFSKRRTSR